MFHKRWRNLHWKRSYYYLKVAINWSSLSMENVVTQYLLEDWTLSNIFMLCTSSKNIYPKHLNFDKKQLSENVEQFRYFGGLTHGTWQWQIKCSKIEISKIFESLSKIWQCIRMRRKYECDCSAALTNVSSYMHMRQVIFNIVLFDRAWCRRWSCAAKA